MTHERFNQDPATPSYTRPAETPQPQPTNTDETIDLDSPFTDLWLSTDRDISPTIATSRLSRFLNACIETGSTPREHSYRHPLPSYDLTESLLYTTTLLLHLLDRLDTVEHALTHHNRMRTLHAKTLSKLEDSCLELRTDIANIYSTMEDPDDA